AAADGSNPRVVAHEVAAGNTFWSPDGQWITYSDERRHLFVVPSDGSVEPTDLGDFDGKGGWTATFSPDSQRLAVAVFDGTLWVIDRDGRNGYQVSGKHQEVAQKGFAADWSPDGRSLVFNALDDDVPNLYLVGVDGSPEVLLARDAQLGVWSPDGKRIA